jgi:ribosome maturation factor RimP
LISRIIHVKLTANKVQGIFGPKHWAEKSVLVKFNGRERRMTGLNEAVLTNIRTFVESTFAGQYEIYDLRFKSENKRLVLQVAIDGPKGITVKDCETVSRSLSRYLDETDLIHQSYNLEVSSPGAERLLKRPVDFERHIGRMVRWEIRGDDGKKQVFQSRLQEFCPDRIVVMSDKETREFPLSTVVEARVVLEFPRKARG